MNIATVVLHNCVRSVKCSWLLMERGHSVSFVTERPADVSGWIDFNSTNLIYTGHLDGHEVFPDQLWATMRTLKPSLDLIYFSSEPEWPLEVIRDAVGKEMPIIYDAHDLPSQRTGVIDQYEQSAGDLADGFMVPSRLYKEIFQARYPYKPCAEVLSCVPEKLFPTERRVPSRRGLVYEGGLKGKPKANSDQFEFRSWADVFKKLSKLNVETWAYPSASGEDFSDYDRAGCIMMPGLPYHELLKNLTAHEVGLVGSPFPSKAFDGALPNKMFEYIAAGIPMISINAPTVADFLAATGFGCSVNSVEEIPDAIEEIRKENLKDYVWEMRQFWTMEKQIGKVETLFNKVMTEKSFEVHGGGNCIDPVILPDTPSRMI